MLENVNTELLLDWYETRGLIANVKKKYLSEGFISYLGFTILGVKGLSYL